MKVTEATRDDFWAPRDADGIFGDTADPVIDSAKRATGRPWMRSLRKVLWRFSRGQFSYALTELDSKTLTSSGRTRLNRCPELFATAAEHAPNAGRVLSYGCSTGEECVSLREYFPTAELVGADVNRISLWRARRKFGAPRLHFIYSRDEDVAAQGPFDVIFAIAVLRVRGNRTTNLPFARFAERIAFLDTILSPGGILVLVSTTYRFVDTETGNRYEKLDTSWQPKRLQKCLRPDGASAGIYSEFAFTKRAT
jgi:SAM-dependent methyltransferase